MNWKELAEKLGIETALDDKNAAQEITAAFEKSKADGDAAKEELEELKASNEDKDPKPDPKPEKRKVSNNELKMSCENRQMKLDALVDKGVIDANTAKKLHTQFVGDKGATLLLSLEEDRDDGFDGIIAALMDNKPVKLGETSGPQDEYVLSDDGKETKVNPLVADAEKRAETAKAFTK